MRLLCRRLAATVALAGAALLPSMLVAQGTGTVEGTVTDAGSQRPLANVQVSVQGVGTAVVGSQTNAQGIFRITNVAAGQQTVRARLIGYAMATAQVTVPSGGVGRVTVEMRQSALELSAVVTTGTGGSQVEARKLGNTVASVELPANAPMPSFSAAMQGREPGVMMLPSSGLTGAGARIRIRGNASLSQSNEPIVYLDGVRVDNGSGSGSAAPSRLDDIDPTSIERLEVLKGAAAATLYGTEASAGVILITTKKGAVSNTKWNLEVEETTKNYPTNRIEPLYGVGGLGLTCANSLVSTCADTQAVRQSYHFGYPIAPYQVINELVPTKMFETGTATMVNGQVSGGTALSTFFASLRMYREDGPFSGKNFDWQKRGILVKDIDNKYQGTLSLGLTPSNQVKLQFNSLFAVLHNELPGSNNDIYAPYTTALLSKPENAQCDASKTGPTDPTYGSAGNGLCVGPGNPTGAPTFGSQRELFQRTNKQDTRHYNGSLRVSYIPTAALNFDATFGVDFTGRRSATFLPFGNNLDLRSTEAPAGSAGVTENENQQLTLSLNGGWTSNPLGLSSNLIFGAQGYITRVNTVTGSTRNFPGPGIEVLSGGSVPQVSESFTSIVNTGLLLQEQLGWHDWVFVTGGGRYDYNSAFGKTSGGVFYPQASFSLVLSDRAGYKDSFLGRHVNTFRIRGALGRAGRQPSAFAKLTTYLPLTTTAGAGLIPGNLGNPDLKPEVSTEMEVGAELGLLNDNLSVEFTRWQRSLKDALVARQFPLSGGFSALQLDNIGQMQSWGYDLKVKAYVINRANLSADVFATTAFLSQIVTSLGGAPPLKVGGSYPRYRNWIREGWAPGVLFGARVPAPCASGKTTADDGSICLAAGQVPVDLNGDGKPDTETQMLAYFSGPRTIGNIAPLQSVNPHSNDVYDHYYGKPLPDFEGAIGGSITWHRNWELSTNFEYRGGHFTISSLTQALRTASPGTGGNTQKRAQVQSTLQNPASTPQQRLDAAWVYWSQLVALSPYDGANQQFPGDFIRWRELSLTYKAPPSWARRVGGSEMSFTFAARNFMMWTRYPGTDPEVNMSGRSDGGGTDNNFGESVDALGFPIPRALSFNIRVGF